MRDKLHPPGGFAAPPSCCAKGGAARGLAEPVPRLPPYGLRFAGRRNSGTGLVAIALLLACTATQAQVYGLGRPATPAAIAAWDIDVSPNGAGLPRGSGSVAAGQAVYAAQCAACHGAKGEGKPADRLVGGQGTLTADRPVKTIGSFWPYATTVFDFIRRAMPYQAPQSLSHDEVYAVTAYLLHLNGIVPADAVLDATSLPQVRMPNRDGFIADARPDTVSTPCTQCR